MTDCVFLWGPKRGVTAFIFLFQICECWVTEWGDIWLLVWQMPIIHNMGAFVYFYFFFPSSVAIGDLKHKLSNFGGKRLLSVYNESSRYIENGRERMGSQSQGIFSWGQRGFCTGRDATTGKLGTWSRGAPCLLAETWNVTRHPEAHRWLKSSSGVCWVMAECGTLANRFLSPCCSVLFLCVCGSHWVPLLMGTVRFSPHQWHLNWLFKCTQDFGPVQTILVKVSLLGGICKPKRKAVIEQASYAVWCCILVHLSLWISAGWHSRRAPSLCTKANVIKDLSVWKAQKFLHALPVSG